MDPLPRSRRTPATALLLAAAGLLLVSCAPSASGADEIGVALTDTGVALDPGRAAAGPVALVTTNLSAALVHEIEVFSGADSGMTLPVSNGVADTTGLHLVDEIEDILPGATVTLTVDLPPGTYLVMCNLPGHFEQGMWSHLEVMPEP